jgi:hypothetical protein
MRQQKILHGFIPESAPPYYRNVNLFRNEIYNEVGHTFKDLGAVI